MAEQKKLVPKTPEAGKAHQEFLRRCAVDLKKLDSPDRDTLINMLCLKDITVHCETKDIWKELRGQMGDDDAKELADQIIALLEPLIKDALKEGYEQAKAKLNSPEVLAIASDALKDAREQEREQERNRILKAYKLCMATQPSNIHLILMHVLKGE